jgi:hypothetical protein
MPRHKFILLPQPVNGAFGMCESCGALNNVGLDGCMSDEGRLRFIL